MATYRGMNRNPNFANHMSISSHACMPHVSISISTPMATGSLRVASPGSLRVASPGSLRVASPGSLRMAAPCTQGQSLARAAGAAVGSGGRLPLRAASPHMSPRVSPVSGWGPRDVPKSWPLSDMDRPACSELPALKNADLAASPEPNHRSNGPSLAPPLGAIFRAPEAGGAEAKLAEATGRGQVEEVSMSQVLERLVVCGLFFLELLACCWERLTGGLALWRGYQHLCRLLLFRASG